MAIVKKARTEDFEKVYPLLLDFRNPGITEKGWEQLFVNHWNNPEDYHGYILIDNKKTVGFMGLIFSSRIINGQVCKFCNITSWIVKNEYRKESPFLLLPVLKLKEYTLTNFTPGKEVYIMLKKLGFKNIESGLRLLPPLPIFDPLNLKCSVKFGKKVKNFLSDQNDIRIYNDHLRFKCFHILIRSKYGDCYIIANRTRRKKIPFAQVHYLSNPYIFLKYIGLLNTGICLRLKVFGLLVGERYFEGIKIKYPFAVRLYQSKLFRSETLKKNEIDTLYSELIILDL